MRICTPQILGCGFLLLATAFPPLWGQESSSRKIPQNGNTEIGPLDPAKAAPLDDFFQPKPGDLLYLLTKSGKLEAVPRDPDLLKKLLELQQEPPKAEQPKYSFSAVSLSGSASDDEATLTVAVSLQILDSEDWVRVPLGLNEGALRKFEHNFKPVNGGAGPQPGGQAKFDRFDRQGGYDWWFKGQGQHTLSLEMIVPLRKSSGVRRLQLAVPSAASSYLKLQVPIAKERLSLEPDSAGARKITPVGTDSTEVELFRLGGRLDFSWRTLPDSSQVTTQLKAGTIIRVEPTEEAILLKARQEVEPLQGSMRELEISLPKGFSVLELKLDGERFALPDEIAEASRSVKIALPAPTTDRIRLDWILQSAWPESGRVVIEEFAVSDAQKPASQPGRVRQSGEIEIAELEGYRIATRPSTGVYRSDVKQLMGPGKIFSAYQFPRQPYQLELSLQQIEPSYSVSPHLFLKMGEKQIDLLLDLDVEVFRGVIQSLEIDWADFEDQGWVIDQAELPPVVEQLMHDPETNRITIELAKRIGQGTVLPLSIRAKRVLTGLANQEFPLTLPRVIATNPVRTVAVVTHDENVESRLTPGETTQTQPLSGSSGEEVALLMKEPRMRDFLGRRQQGFFVRTDAHTFQVELVTHPQSIQMDTRVRVTVSEEEVRVRQTLRYEVDYAPVSQLRISVPPSFPVAARFSLGSVPLPFEWMGTDEENPRQARLTLPEPALNEFELVAEYSVPSAVADARQLTIPLVRGIDGEFGAARLEFESDYRPEVTVSDSGWAVSTDAELAHVWTSDEPGNAVRLAWTPRREADIQRFKISGARIQTAIQSQGPIYSVAQYRLDQAPNPLLIQLPPDQIRPSAFFWNGMELTAEQVSETDSGSGLFQLEWPENPDLESPEAALVVAYHTREDAALDWRQKFDLAAPAFPGDVWTEKTTWDITLPVDQHLFSPPGDYVSEFSWTRQGFMWRRIPHEMPGDSESLSAIESLRDHFPGEGNTYRFSHVGPCPPLRFSSMNRSVIVLFGAGLALLVGFLLLKIPATRNVFTMLCLMFGFALAGVWYAAPMQLLIQPAVLGLLLAIVALLMDGSFKRTSPGTAITSTADFSGSSAAHVFPGYPEPIGSEDPTAVRQSLERQADSAATRNLPEQRTEDDVQAEFVGSSISEKSE